MEIQPIFKKYICNEIVGNPVEEALEFLYSFYEDEAAMDYFYFEKSLRILKGNIEKKYDRLYSNHKNFIDLYLSLIYTYIDEPENANKYYAEVSEQPLNQIDPLFGRIYIFLGQYIKMNYGSSDKVNNKIVISRNLDDESGFFLYYNLRFPENYRALYKLENSVDNLNFSQLFSNNQILFICGHGSNHRDSKGLKYYIDNSNSIRLIPSLIQDSADKIKILGLFNCSFEPYQKYTNGALADYLILSEGNMSPEYSEIFIKAFNLTLIRKGDYEMSLKMALIALLFRSKKPFPMVVYDRNGSEITI